MSEHLGDGWNKLLHPDDRPRAFAAWRDAVEGRAPYDLEYRVRRHDGEYEWFKVRGRPIRDAAGHIVRWFGTALNIEDLKRAEERLKDSLREKEVLLQEIHHRVKNNLQVISSLINLQADALDQPALRASLNDVRDRVRTMALVHEKLYQSGDLARLNFADYAASLMHYLWRVHGEAADKVRLTLATQPTTLPVGVAVPCGLILNELASNALKHAFHGRAQGEVTVGLERDAATNRLCLRVSDDGMGLPAGLDVRRSTSLGLRLVHMLTQQIGGTVEVSSGPGAEFRVVFAAPEGS
jgi:two-component sensor histidine kinase